MPKIKPLPAPVTGRVTNLRELGRIIRHRRMQSGLTVEEAALSIGVVKATLLRAEQGKGGLQFDNLMKILGGLGLSMVVWPTNLKAPREMAWPKE